MNRALHLTITTPLKLLLDTGGVTSLRAEDASGDFGIQPGHADFLTVIDAGVLRWKMAEETWHYCALRGGIFTVSEGHAVRIACREGIFSDDLSSLQARVASHRAEALDIARQARTQGTKLHAQAIRHLMREMSFGGDTLGLGPETES